jgi:hypothetical protein
VLLGVLDVNKVGEDYLVHLCDLSEGAKEDLSVCILACCGSLMEQLALVRSDSYTGGIGG